MEEELKKIKKLLLLNRKKGNTLKEFEELGKIFFIYSNIVGNYTELVINFREFIIEDLENETR